MTETAGPGASSRVLSAPLWTVLDCTRFTGPVLGAFMTGLRERRIGDARTSDGRVVVPSWGRSAPLEARPQRRAYPAGSLAAS